MAEWCSGHCEARGLGNDVPAAPPRRAAARRSALRRVLLGSVASAAVSAGPGLALAQSAYPTVSPPAASPVAGSAMQVPSVSVQGAETAPAGYKADQPTIPKLTEPLVNTPQTIEVVPRQLLDDQGVTTFRDALRNVPGISLAAGEGAAQGDSLNIRGFSARSDIYLDGMRDFGSYYRDPFYLEDIQVLKGPSSILFGRGSTGGIIEQDSKLPQPTPFIAGTGTFGSDLTRRLTADVNQPLPGWGEGAAIRLNAMVQDGNVADRDAARNSRFGLAPSLVLGLGTPTRLTFTYLHQSEYDIPDYGLPWVYQGTPGTAIAIAHPAPLSVAQSNYYGFENANYLRTNVDVPTAKIEHDFGNGLLVSDQLRYAHYIRQFDITEPQLYTTASVTTPGASGAALLVPPGTPLGSLNVARNQLYGHSLETFLENQLDATAHFATGFLDHTLRAGIEVGRETSDPVRYSTIGPYSLTPLGSPNPEDAFNANTFRSSRTNTTALTQAVYALDTMKLGERWQVMGGLRFDRFDASYGQVTYANPVTGSGAGDSAFNHVDKALSWRGAVIYKPLPAGSIYFDAGTSFDPSAEQLSLSAATAPLPPVRNKSYELGTKWEVNDGALALNGALFHTEQTNVREPDPTNPLFNILAGNAVAKGVEMQAAGYIAKPWEIVAGYAYTFSAIEKSPTVGPTSDLGHRLANTPLHSASLWTTYQTPWRIAIGAGINVVSSRFAATTPTTAGGVAFFKEVPGYWTLGAMAKYPLTEKVALQLNLYNLTDNKYYDQLHPAHVVPGAGTTALFTVSFRY